MHLVGFESRSFADWLLQFVELGYFSGQNHNHGEVQGGEYESCQVETATCQHCHMLIPPSRPRHSHSHHPRCNDPPTPSLQPTALPSTIQSPNTSRPSRNSAPHHHQRHKTASSSKQEEEAMATLNLPPSKASRARKEDTHIPLSEAS